MLTAGSPSGGLIVHTATMRRIPHAICAFLAVPLFATAQIPPVPAMTEGRPSPGQRVKVTEPEYAGTDVHHSLYLPPDFQAGKPLPMIVEFTGNYYPVSGSTGEVSGAHLGYALTHGKDFIWLILPFVAKDGKSNEKTWWGDTEATVAYAKKCIARLIEHGWADPRRIVLCGFSRGAIAVSYIGLHDDEIAKIWAGFLTHDHFDGINEWKKTDWGSPLAKYQSEAATRLSRVNGRPFWVGQRGSTKLIEEFLQSRKLLGPNYEFRDIPIAEILQPLPEKERPHLHNDVWPLLPSKQADEVGAWLDQFRAKNEK